MELRERNQDDATLRDKLRVKWNTRDFTPNEDHTNKISMGYFMVMTLSLFFECQYYLIPAVFPETKWLQRLAVLIMLGEIVVNWHRSYYDVDNYVTAETKEKYFPDTTETPEGWKACYKCQVDTPPRSYHCKFCGKCMLKRVQHCFITGSCIGYFNQKFFIMFLLWSFICNVYCMYVQLSYLNEYLPLYSGEIVAYIAPITLHRWCMGYITFGQFLLVLQFYMCAFNVIISVFFFGMNVMLVLYGYTTHEAWKGINAYRGSSVLENIRSVFVSVWYIPVLVFIPYRFKHNGDGVQWALRRKRVKGH